MNYIEFKKSFLPYQIFSIKDIRSVYPNFDRRRLSEWSGKGYIKKLIKGFYIFSDIAITADLLQLVSNKIYHPSYISLEKAFEYYNLIPEGTFTITAITTNKTFSFLTPIGSFQYRSIKEELFWGYTFLETENRKVKMAFPEKAVLDYLYLNPKLNLDDIFELRFNKEKIEEIISSKNYKLFLQRFNSKAVEKRSKLLEESINL